MVVTIESKMLEKALQIRGNDVSLKTWLFLIQKANDIQSLTISTSLHEIANDTGCSVKTVERRINQFEENNWIKTHRSRRGSVIEILA